MYTKYWSCRPFDFITEYEGKPTCLVCQDTVANKEYNVKRYFDTHHAEKLEGLTDDVKKNLFQQLRGVLRAVREGIARKHRVRGVIMSLPIAEIEKCLQGL